MERSSVKEVTDTTILRGSGMAEENGIHGEYSVKCISPDGVVKWEDNIDNLITNAGANLMLDTLFGGSQNTAYYLGLISSVGGSTIVAADTMASHAGWTEAGDATNLPQWTTPASNARVSVSWSSATGRAKAISSTANFTISAAGTVIGCFIVTGSGAVSTHDSTAGTLYSAGTFSGGNKAVGIGDTLQVSYSTSLS